jgi:hypothetical protein
MEPKEIRKEILNVLYKYRDTSLRQIENLQEKLIAKKIEVDFDTLYREIEYLMGKNYLEIQAKSFGGPNQRNLLGLKITSYGIDLVEDPEEFNKLFSIKIHANSFGNINNSNLSIDSSNIQQIINNEADEDLKLRLKELEYALKERNKSKIIKILSYIGDKSVDLLISVVAGSIKQ